jgi:hypothetical protein
MAVKPASKNRSFRNDLGFSGDIPNYQLSDFLSQVRVAAGAPQCGGIHEVCVLADHLRERVL